MSIFVDREQRRVTVSINEFKYSTPLNPIPNLMLRTMLKATDYEEGTIKDLERLKISRVFEGTISTYNSEKMFPINLAVKLIFPTLDDETIDEVVDDLEGRLLSFQGLPIEDTIEERLKLLRSIFLDESKIDPYRLGTLEIYGELSYKNLLRDPRTTIIYRWLEGSRSKSVQLNCITEIAQPKTAYFRFIRVLRSLFATRFVDLLGVTRYVAYKFWICDSISKDLDDRRGFAM